VGLAVAGPAGMLVGLRVGSAACRAVVAIETIQFCILIGGTVAGVSHAVQQAKEGKVKILTFGGSAVGEQKVALVRPYIVVDPDWDEIVRKAKKQAFWDGLKSNALLMNTSPQKRRNHHKDSDILCAGEDEIDSTDKVFLLVSRSVSNRRSLPGFVYRYLLEEFRSRMDADVDISKDDVVCGEEIPASTSSYCSRSRRQDCHAIIHHVTLTLIEVRPGLGSSAKITEMTATAVESLVFGELYEYIFEEILLENKAKDEALVQKIQQFEALQQDGAPKLSSEALNALSMVPESVAVVDKMSYCVQFLEFLCAFSKEIDRGEEGNENGSTTNESSGVGADSLLKLVCEHILAAGQIAFQLNAEIGFLTEFARDEYLLRGKEGYTLVTLQAALHFLQSPAFFANL